MNKISKSSMMALLLCIVFTSCANTVIERKALFVNADSASIPYRIPAIAAFDDGTLTTLADYRHCRSDIGYGRVDIKCRISPDNGKTWGDEITVVEGTGKSGCVDCGFGDPALACDRESGELLLLTVCGETVYWKSTTNRQNPNRIAALRSTDKGKTWTQWNEITEDIYSLFDDCSKGCVESCFVGSGRIFQSSIIKVGSHYRLYAALCARPNGNRVIFSDDFGKTWKALGGPEALPAPGGDEPKCEELPDGRVILSSRAKGGRIFNIFSYTDITTAKGSWDKASFSGEKNHGCTAIENACNGEILIVNAIRKQDRKKVSLALQSVPLGPHRTNVGIYHKELPDDITGITSESFASDWEGPYQISTTDSAYSTMVLQSNGKIGFFYEETLNADITGYNLIYLAIPVDSLSFNRYK